MFYTLTKFNFYPMKSIKLVLALLVGTLTLNSCMKGGEPTPIEPQGVITLTNAFTPEDGVSYYLDNNKMGDQQYANGAIVGNIGIGTRELSVTKTNSNPIADIDITVEDGHWYSAFLFGTEEAPKFYAVEESFDLEEQGTQTAIRFIHLANDLDEEVDFFIGDEKIEDLSGRIQDTQASLEDHKKFIFVDNGTHDILIKDKEGNELASLKSAQLRSSDVLSLHLVGNHDDEDEDNDQPLKLIAMSFVYSS